MADTRRTASICKKNRFFAHSEFFVTCADYSQAIDKTIVKVFRTKNKGKIYAAACMRIRHSTLDLEGKSASKLLTKRHVPMQKPSQCAPKPFVCKTLHIELL